MRNCNYIGNPPMFHSRVSGVSGLISKMLNDINISPMDLSQMQCIGPGCRIDGGMRAQVCPPVCPEGYVPPSQRPPTIPMVEPATGGSALPLVIGAALLLLS